MKGSFGTIALALVLLPFGAWANPKCMEWKDIVQVASANVMERWPHTVLTNFKIYVRSIEQFWLVDFERIQPADGKSYIVGGESLVLIDKQTCKVIASSRDQ